MVAAFTAAKGVSVVEESTNWIIVGEPEYQIIVWFDAESGAFISAHAVTDGAPGARTFRTMKSIYKILGVSA